MSNVLSVVVRGGALHLLEPVDLVEGQTLAVQVVDEVPGLERPLTDQEVDEFKAALGVWNESARRHSDAFWDDFDQFLRENRVNFEERFDPLSLGYECDLDGSEAGISSSRPAAESTGSTVPGDPLSGSGVRNSERPTLEGAG